MATVTQANYNDRPPIGVVGQCADMTTSDVVSRVCETGPIAFGLAVIKGTTDKQAKLGAAGVFIGITVEDKTLLPDNADTYVAGGAIAIATRGSWFASPTEAVAYGDAVYRAADGTLNKTSSGNTLIANAYWGSTTAANGIGIIVLR